MENQPSYTKYVNNYAYNSAAPLGKGFSSVVYKGCNVHTHQKVAIKVVDLKFIKSDLQRTLLQNEVKCLSSLNHQNVIKVIEVCQTSNNIYIISELCQQGDLADFVKKNERMKQPVIFGILLQLAKGLHYVHSKGFLHRDFKTANVLLKGQTPKIADFGFAIPVQQCGFRSSYNVGSPLYMSPEAHNKSEYSFKSDVWGLGVILAEMLLGDQPFQGLSYNTLVRRALTGELYSSWDVSNFAKLMLSKLLSVDIRNRILPIELIQMLEGGNIPIPSAVSGSPKGSNRAFKNMVVNAEDPRRMYPDVKQMKQPEGFIESKRHMEKRPQQSGYTSSPMLPPGKAQQHQYPMQPLQPQQQQQIRIPPIIEPALQPPPRTIEQVIVRTLKDLPHNPAIELSVLDQRLELADVLEACYQKVSSNKDVSSYVTALCLSHMKFNLTLLKELSSNDPRVLAIERRTETIAQNAEQSIRDPYLNHVLKHITPQTQTFCSYTLFWLNSTIKSLSQVFGSFSQDINSSNTNQRYQCYMHCIKYSQVLDHINSKDSMAGTLCPSNQVLDCLIKEEKPANADSLNYLSAIADVLTGQC